MSPDNLEKAWQIFDQSRGERYSLDSPRVVQAFKEQGLSFTLREFQFIVSRIQGFQGTYFMPESFLAFVRKYVRVLNVKSILDPFAEFGILLMDVCKSVKPQAAVGVTQSPIIQQYASFVPASAGIEWIQSSPLRWLEQNHERFDLIVSVLPLGMMPERITLSTEAGAPVTIRDQQGYLVLLKSSLSLTEQGTGIFVVADTFFLRSQVRESLQRFGLYIDAALAIPKALSTIHTPVSLVIVKRAQPNQLFVGQLSDNPKKNNQLLKNLHERKPSKTLAFGTLIDEEAYRGFQTLVAQRRAQEIAQQLNLTSVLLSDVALRISRPKQVDKNQYEFEDLPHSVYVPVIGYGDAVTTLVELKTRTQNYLQIVLDPTRADNQYVAALLNSRLGIHLRSTASSGMTTPLSLQSVQSMEIYLPDLVTQHAVIQTDTQIGLRIQELEERRSQLWATPQSDKTGLVQPESSVDNTRRLDRGVADWIDALPFPLASILWAYHATSETHSHKRYRLLQRYFEAFTQFMAAVLLSGLYNDQEWFEDEKKCFAKLELNWRRSSFGMWKSIVERLVTLLYQKLDSDNVADSLRCEQAFRTSREILRRVFPRREAAEDDTEKNDTPDLIAIIEKTNSLRNEWRGHGGIDDAVAGERLHILEAHLLSTRTILHRAWEEFRLIKPDSNRIIQGVAHQEVQFLMGHHNPFVSRTIELDEALDTTFLYLHSPGESSALKLQPFVTIFEKLIGEENACYFYSRIRHEQEVTFISHHFEQEPDISDIFPETIEAINKISGEVE